MRADLPPASRAGAVVEGWSLRSVLISALLIFSILPALLVGLNLYNSNQQTVDTLAASIVQDVAQRVQSDTETHLRSAQTVFNAVMPADPNLLQIERAAQLLDNPALFEQTAFALTSLSADVPYLYVGTRQGEFFGVEATSPSSQVVVVQRQNELGRQFFTAARPADRSQPVIGAIKPYDARNRPWYVAAVKARGRVFTPVYASASKKQLIITLAQPVFGKSADGTDVVGVFAVDLFLNRLSELMRSQQISTHGAAFLVDESGFMVANSVGDALFTDAAGQLLRRKPSESANASVRLAYSEMLPYINRSKTDSVERVSFQGRVGGGNSALIAVMRPFGEAYGVKWSLVVVAPESDFASVIQADLRRTLWQLLLLVLVGAGLAAFFAQRLSRHFEQLSYAAAQLGRGQLPALQGQARIAEVRQLSRVLRSSGEDMLRSRAEIAQQTSALQDANEHLEERVAKRTTELQASREEALAAARAKASFLATMSHEIRTPLNGVVGMTTLLADTPLNTEQRDYLHTMRVSSDQLLGVINDILDFSKIESGKLELEAEPLSLRATIEEACDMAAPRAREKGLELLADLDTDLPEWVHGDVTRLRQVLLNFINNAVKFTEHGQVLVSVHLRPEAALDAQAPRLIEFRVKDSGIGIPLDRQSALFQSFSQVDASTTRKYGGTGLGLAICKRLAGIMGGEVGVQSAPGEGAVFWFTARLAPAAAPDVLQAQTLETASLANQLALVVDDTELNLRILDKQLKRWGMRTALFERAQPALDWLEHNQPAVIITDMHMPEMDGQSFAQAIRVRQPGAHVVLLTSGVMPTGREAKVFDARLLKPYRQSQLFNALSRVSALPAEPAVQRDVVLLNKRILVADDNAINLKVALAMLAKLGYTAATAVNGREAADLVDQALSRQAGAVAFAAVLMDANMPVMDGFDAARLILSTHGAAAPPIIALTASVLEEDRQRCFDAGMQGFLAKPLRIDELAEALARYAVSTNDAIKNIAARTYKQGAAAVFDTPKKDTSAEQTNQPHQPHQPHHADQVASQLVLIDWSRLEQFKEFDDDAQTMTREIMSLFMQDAPSRCAALESALLSGNTRALAQAAHALKGSASNVGAQAVSDVCAQLELACLQDGWPADAATQVAQALELTDRTQVVLTDWLAPHPGPGDLPGPAPPTF